MKFTAFYGSQPFNFDDITIIDLEYTEQDILDQLHFKNGTNEIKFKYDLLDKNERKKKTLDTVIGGEISMAAFAQIKRTAKFKLKEDKDIDYLSDRIRPYCLLKMPNGSWVEWSLGIFLLTSPSRVEENSAVYVEVDAYDSMIILRDDKLLERYTIKAGTNYISAIYTLLRASGIKKVNIELTDMELNVDKEFEAGTEVRQVINELLDEINWSTLWVDEDGYFTSSRYESPANRAATLKYYDDELSILSSGMSEDLDLAGIANTWVITVSNPEEIPLTSSYVNDNEDSPTSTVNRGRVITDFRERDSIANQEALDSLVSRLAFNASQVYGYLQFETAINPLHSYSDIIDVRYNSLDIKDKYAETNWTMPLESGGMMKHEVRKVVNIS